MRNRWRNRCLRCGKPTAWGRSVCDECNPAGLPEPSQTQYHATVFITILLVLGVLAIVAIALR